MTRRIVDLTSPDRFDAAAVGEPGARRFYLQARQGRARVVVGVEKLQVADLAVRIAELLTEVGHAPPAVADNPERRQDLTPSEQPTAELFRVGAIAIAWDPVAERLVVEAQPISDEGAYVEASDDAPDGPDIVRVRLDATTAAQFAQRAARLVAAGRPICPFCGQPLEPQGHFCARSNGQLN